MSERKLTIGLVQQKGDENRQVCLDRTITGLREASNDGAKLVLLQELHMGLYFCQEENHQLFDLAESIPGPTTDILGKLAKELKIVIISSLFERRTAGIYHNTAVVFEKDGNIAGKYRKMHIPHDPGFAEKYYFTPGDLGFTPIQTSVGKLGVLVCWDQWFPEAARIMALAGAELLLYPTAIGWVPKDNKAEQQRQLEAWITIQRAHAIANHLPVIVCNRVGTEKNIQFWGSSFVAGPQGEILAQASIGNPEVLVTEIDLNRTEYLRRHWPHLRDRRIDAYQGLLGRFQDTD